MKFNIPAEGKTLSHGKQLVSIKGGVFETEDKALIKLLMKAASVQLVEEVKAKAEVKSVPKPKLK